MTSKTLAPRAPMTPVRCASWCTDGTGHTRAGHVEDQYCHSLLLEMPSSLHDLSEGETVAVYARKEADTDTAYVVVCTLDDREMRMTVDEARRVIEYLEHMVWVAQQDTNARNAFTLGPDSVRTGLVT